MCAKCEALQKQLDDLKEVVNRGFGQLANSKDLATQQAARQVTQTLKAQKQRIDPN